MVATQHNHSQITKTNKPDHKPDHKPDRKPAKPSFFQTSKFSVIVAIIAAVVVVAVAIIAICTNNNSFTVTNGQGEKITTAYHAFAGDHFRIKIPTTFTELSKSAIAEKYGTEAPSYVYADTENNVNITVNLTDSTIANDQINNYLHTVETIFNTSGQILSVDSYQINDYNVATIQLNSESTAGNFYNHMAFFSQEGKLVIVSFNCPTDQQATWQNVGEFVIKSLSFQD